MSPTSFLLYGLYNHCDVSPTGLCLSGDIVLSLFLGLFACVRHITFLSWAIHMKTPWHRGFWPSATIPWVLCAWPASSYPRVSGFLDMPACVSRLLADWYYLLFWQLQLLRVKVSISSSMFQVLLWHKWLLFISILYRVLLKNNGTGEITFE